MGDPDNISFALRIIQSQGSFQEPSFSATDLTQFDGTVNVSFPVSGCVPTPEYFPISTIHSLLFNRREYQIPAKNDEFGLATSQKFDVAPSGSGNTVLFRPYLHITRNGDPLCEDRRRS